VQNLKLYKIQVRALFFFLSFFASTAFYAQNTATVYGKVVDEDNEPIEDVSVSVLGTSLAPVYTNAQGTFSYKVPAGVPITIVFYSISHFQQQRDINIQPNEKFELNRTLKFKNQIKAVEVYDENRFQTTSRIDPINITHIPTASQDFNAILFTLPGVSNRNELSSAYSVRGGNFDENLVYVNGIEIYRPFLVRSGAARRIKFCKPRYGFFCIVFGRWF
jgi:uncharacterized membrane protein